MANLNKRLGDLEAKRSKQSARGSVLTLPDNGRGAFRVFDESAGSVKVIPSGQSHWPDGSMVFDSLTNPPAGNNVNDLTESQWEELRAAELNHQWGTSE